ncbi:MAG: hypothetical protein LKF49_04910 [Bifidobacterium tibiigranuli]|jgi:hypothetical protein|uniref:TcaA 3rd/4th domain-containing protein n=1 Tax=Bifidobacterium tibiigranuli TaxID=2172043 RepID=UPI002354F962|nr:hypothetical protein [Bifidobacterium tibiigranuli]MCH3975336.1 hypothetical protein [Bifidobacterium tibiigranuli]MCH4203535.1 hypothetical protein [Bifidobacterium tibiigranuli]MCH4273853.1 hypothetical protein [Bifidobacterium tibiigranuli]MCI1254815.1 hypothetical protein [Bifidobacterium tibiigranuli]MCI1791093.1 hypothetical protein [Bifidobacterium tibiigranuli]
MNPQQWASLFAQAFDRKPTIEEFSAAKEAGFPITSLTDISQEALPRVWAQAFETLQGRKPTAQEFLFAKQGGFDLTVLDAVAAHAQPEIPNAGSAAQNSAIQGNVAQNSAAQSSASEQMPSAAATDNTVAMPQDALPSTVFPADAAATTIIEAVPSDDQINLRAVSDVLPDPPAAQMPLQPGSVIGAAGAAGATAARTKWSRLIMWLAIAAAVLLWIIASALYFCFNYFGVSPTGFSFYWTHQSSTLTRYADDYDSHAPLDESTLGWYVWQDTGKALQASDIAYKPTLPSSLSISPYTPNQGLLPGTSVQRTGTQYLIFPKYQIAVAPQEVAVSTDTSGLDLALHGRVVGTSDSTSYSASVKRLFPGKYQASARGTVNNVKIDLAKSVDAVKGRTHSDFNLQFVTFHLYSNVLNADVFIGDSKIGTLDGGDYKFNQIPVLADQQLQVQRTFRDGVVKTKSVLVSSIADGSSLYLNWGQELSNSAANDLFSKAQSIFSQLSNAESADNVSSVFEGGTGNSAYIHFRDDSVTNIKSPLPGFMPKSISFSNVNVNSIEQTGVNTYNVSWTMTWDFYYPDVKNDDNSQTADGDYLQTCQYLAQVKYVPTGSASTQTGSDSGSGSSSYDGSQSTSSGGAGDDSSNFLITSLDPSVTVANESNNVTINSVDSSDSGD